MISLKDKSKQVRVLGAATVAAVALGALPISPVGAAIADICPGPGQTDAFTDDEGSVHEDNISCAEAYGIVNGTSATTYDPAGALTRGQAASLLVQFAETARGSALTADANDEFDDDDGSVHEANIDKAADNDLLEGFGDGTFRPGANISRAQFASIAVQTVELVLGRQLTSNTTNSFDDDNGTVHEGNIEKAADNGILEGTGPRAFSPNADIQRDQAATILVRAAGNVLFPEGRFAPGAAAEGDLEQIAGTITGVEKGTDSFTTGTGTAARRFAYDVNDVFRVDGTSVGLVAFEAALSGGDGISGAYTTDPAGVSTFDLADTAPPAPSSVSAEAGTGAATDDITVTVVAPAGAGIDGVVIQRAPVSGGTDEAADGTVGAYATVATPTTDASSADTGFQYVDVDVTAGTYRYRAALVHDGDQGSFTTDAGNETAASPAAVETGLPTISDARAQDEGTTGLLDGGDVIQLLFSEAMAVTADDPGQLLRVSDADGTVAEVVCGGNATCALQGAGTFNGVATVENQVLRLFVSAAVSPVTEGTAPGLQLPVTITNVSSGFDDTSGNQLDLAASDVSIDVAAITPTPTADSTGPNIVFSVADESANSVTLTYNEAVVCESSAAVAAAFGYSDANDVDVAPTAVTCNGTTTVTLSFASGIILVADATGANINYSDEMSGAVDANDVRNVTGLQANAVDNNVPTVQA